VVTPIEAKEVYVRGLCSSSLDIALAHFLLIGDLNLNPGQVGHSRLAHCSDHDLKLSICEYQL